MLHDTRRSEALGERERIRRELLRRRPSLSASLHEGASGALTIPVGGGRAIEVGRMRRGGRPRWVVVEPLETGARVHAPAALEDCAVVALAALSRHRRRTLSV